MQKNIIFDLDGTLFRTETVDVEAFNRALTDVGFPKLPASAILNYIGRPLSVIARLMTGQSDPTFLRNFIERIKHHENILIPECGKLYPGTLKTLETLRKRGHILSICSNGNKEYVEQIVEQFSIASLMDSVRYKQYGISKT